MKTINTHIVRSDSRATKNVNNFTNFSVKLRFIVEKTEIFTGGPIAISPSLMLVSKECEDDDVIATTAG